MYEYRDSEVCPLLHMVIERGNITTYEWRTGRQPTSIIDTLVQTVTDDDQAEQTADEVKIRLLIL